MTDTLADTARRVDPDRFLVALFVPAARREAAFALICLNDALARAAEQAGARSGVGPIAALIRLQWWREVIEGERADWRRDPVAVAVRTLIEAGCVQATTLAASVAAREAEAEGFTTTAGWRETMLDGPGALQRALGEALDLPARAMDALAAVGAAYGSAALRRNLPAVLRSGRCPLPDEMLGMAGTDRATLLADPDPARLAPVAEVLAHEGRRFAELVGRLDLPRSQVAAGLLLRLARRDLRRSMLPAAAPRGLGDRLAVLRGYVAGTAR